MEQRIKLTTRIISATPLTVYSIPCNETSPLLPTGFGQCPSTLTMSIPIFGRRVVRYIPWIVTNNHSTLNLHYKSLKIKPRLQFNKSTIKALDETFNRIDGPLNKKIELIKDDIDSIQETTETTTTQIIACAALTLAIINIALVIVVSCLLRRTLRPRTAGAQRTTVKYTKGDETLVLDPHCKDCGTTLHSSDVDES